jgi:hypothetical protein
MIQLNLFSVNHFAVMEAWLFWELLITRERGWLGGMHPKNKIPLFLLSSLAQTLE